MDLCDRTEVAVKMISKIDLTPKLKEQIRLELKILNKCRHKNIIQFKRIKETQDSLYIVTEYVKGGNLGDYMKKRNRNKQYFSEEEASVIMKHLLEALSYLHLKNIIHRDIKPGNILL